MGVQGLWELLAPVGRRVSVETLSGRKLAIDASIWMVQFMKAMRDERGEMVRNAHLIGFFRRICKLLFLRVKPVFVFDGGTPALKRRTIIARRRRRENASAKIRKTAEKLLLNQLKARKLEQLAHDIESGKENVTEEVSEGSKGRGRKRNRGGSIAKTGETSREDGPSNKIQVGSNSFTGAAPENSQVNFQDAYQSNDALLAASLEAEGQLDTDAYDLRDNIPSDGGEDGDQMMIPEIQGKVDPAVLSVLPPSMQLDLLVQMREQLMAENRQKFRKAKKAPASFSQLQIESYLKTVAFRREIEEIQKSASGRAVGGVQTSRIASESNREFIFSSSFTGDKQLLNTDNIGDRSEHQASNATSMSSTLLSQDSTAQTSNKGLHENSDHTEQTYIDDRGKIRVSRVRGMGVRLTRDLQWNLYLMKELEARVPENDRCISNEKLLTPQSQRKELNNVGEEEVGVEHAVCNKKKSEDPCSSLSMSQDPSLLAMPELGTGKSYKISFTVDETKQESDDDLFDSLVSGVMNDNEKIKPTGLSQSKEDSSECEWEDGEVKQASDGEMQKGYLNSEGGTYLSDVAHGDSDIEWEDGNDFTHDTKYSLNDSTFQKSNRSIEDEELQKAIKLSLEADNQKHYERILSEEQPEYVVVDDKDGKVDAAMEDCVSAKTASESAFNSYKDFSSIAFDRIGTTIQEEEDLLECDKSLSSCFFASPKKKHLTEDEELQEALKRSLDDIHGQKENLSSLTDSSHADNINKNEECIFDKYLDSKIVGDGEKKLTIMGDINNSREFNVGLKGVVQNSAAVENMTAKVDEEVMFSNKGDIILQSHEGDAVIVDDQSCIPGEIQKSGLFEINSESHSKSCDPTSQINNTNKVVAERDSVIIEDDEKLPLDNSSLDEVLQNKLPKYKVDSSDEKDLLALREDEVVERNETERDLEIDNEAVQLDIAEEIALLRQEELELRAAQKQNERNAESVSNEMFTECQELLQMFGLPYIIAPMEAEAQCAFMELSQLVDGVVTDDCDGFLFGAETVYKNIFDNRKYVETYLMKDIERELGLNREKLIQMALLLGSDYTEGISGIGIVNAIEVVNAFSEEDGLKTFREWLDSPDTTILDKLDGKRKAPGKKSKHCNKQGNVTESKDDLLLDINETGSEEGNSQEPHSVLKKIFMEKHRAISKNWHVPDSFPNGAVISAYSTPQVDTSTEPFSWGRPDLMSLRKLCWEKFGWAKEKADDLLLPVLKEHDRHETQLRMEAFYSFNERFAKIRSRRIQKAVTGITGSRSSDLMDLPPHLKSHTKSNITKAKKNDKSKDVKHDGSGEMGGTDNVTRLSDPLNSSIVREIDKNENTAAPNNSGNTGEKMTRKESLTRRGQVKRKEGKARRTSNKNKLCNKSQSSEDDSDTINASEDVDYLKKKVPHENLQTRKSSRRKKNVNYALDEHGSDTADHDDDKYSDSSFEVAEKLKEKKQSSIDSPREKDRDESTPFFRDSSYELMDGVYVPDHLKSGGGFCNEEDDSANLELKDGTVSPTGKIMDFDHLRSGGGFCDEVDDSANLEPKDGVASSIGKTVDCVDSDAILICSNVNSNSKKDHDAVACEGSSSFAKADNSSERSETILKKCESSDLFEGKQNKIDDEESVKGLRAIPFLRRRKRK